ncbi:MAG: hypothetical protein ACI4J4_07535 [Ruminiclostridium sp.]
MREERFFMGRRPIPCKPFEKGLTENFQPLRDLAAAFQNNGKQQRGFMPCCFLSAQVCKKFSRKAANVQQMSPHKANAAIKLQTGQAPSRLPGVKGAGSPLAAKTQYFFSQNLFSL